MPDWIFGKKKMPAIHLIVKGRVQGVFFRASARDKAKALRLTGWVRNCADGSVEALACGNRDALDAFKAWCLLGPPGALVTSVVVEDRPDASFKGFSILK